MNRIISLLIVSILIICNIVFISDTATCSEFGLNTSLSEAVASFIGQNEYATIGGSLSIVGDVNGDGFDDILLGSSGNDEGGHAAGKAYLIFGRPSNWILNSNLSDADASFIGEAEIDQAGFSVSRAGDVNNDGFDDFLIGAPHNDESGNRAGKTYLILGRKTNWELNTNLSTADISFIGENNGDFTGSEVSDAGDVNGDGFDDFLIKSYSKTYLIFGKKSGWTSNTSLSLADSSFLGGDYYAAPGDVNGDGFDDILIGSGASFLFFGKPDGWELNVSLTKADAQYNLEPPNEYYSNPFDAGDVNNDGYDDFLICVSTFDQAAGRAGKTYLFFGKANGWQKVNNQASADASFLGESKNDYSGTSASRAGDVNGDGYDDFIIGAPGVYNGGSLGKTYLILGRAQDWRSNISLSEANASFLGEYQHGRTGWRVSGGGDVNNDGFDDFLTGGPNNLEDRGMAYLVFYETKPPAPSNLNYHLSNSGDEIILTWDVTDYWKNLTGFNIYKSENGVTFSLVLSVNASIFSYIDTNVEILQTYYYRLTTTSTSDLVSYFSKTLKIFNDADNDGDGIVNYYDVFPDNPFEWNDTDKDGIGDNSDMFPIDPNEWIDTDKDGIGDNSDVFPLDPYEWNDTDEDGIGDNSDVFPLDPHEWNDTDKDGIGDNSDVFPLDPHEWNDTDEDGFGDNSDVFPLDPHEWNDTDKDGIGDNSDMFPIDPHEWNDTDEDGFGDNSDVFPLDPYEWNDTDKDGIGDNRDAFPNDLSVSVDTDGDGYPDKWNDGKSELDSTTGLVLDIYPNDENRWKKSEENENFACSILVIGSIIIISLLLLTFLYILLQRRRSTGSKKGYEETEIAETDDVESVELEGQETDHTDAQLSDMIEDEALIEDQYPQLQQEAKLNAYQEEVFGDYELPTEQTVPTIEQPLIEEKVINEELSQMEIYETGENQETQIT